MFLVIRTNTGTTEKEAFRWIGGNWLALLLLQLGITHTSTNNLSTSTHHNHSNKLRNQLWSQSKSNGAKDNCCVWVWEQLVVVSQVAMP